MPRRARIAVSGIAWHIIQRGNNRSASFYADDDYRKYRGILEEQARRHGWVVHAYANNRGQTTVFTKYGSGPIVPGGRAGQAGRDLARKAVD